MAYQRKTLLKIFDMINVVLVVLVRFFSAELNGRRPIACDIVIYGRPI